jgi:flagellar basal-body rod modification protein FlgD
MAQTGAVTSTTAPWRTTDNMNSGSSGSSSGIQDAASIQKDFMNLLITQLRNQTPDSPMDSNQMASQLTQLSQLQQVEQLGKSVQQMTFSQQMSQGAGLLGKAIAYQPKGAEVPLAGVVSQVQMQDGAVKLKVGNDLIDIASVLAVQNP